MFFQNTTVRYLFAIATVVSMFAFKIWLIPLTGTGGPFVLFFAAVMVTSLFAGVGPGICSVLLSMPLGAYTFVVRAGYPIGQASFQSLLFAIDGLVVIYLTFLTRKRARSLENANRQVIESREKYRALFNSIDEGFCVIEVLIDDEDHTLDYRFLEVNPVFKKQTGLSNVVGRRMREIAPAHEEHWFQTYWQIARTGESRRFEYPANALGRFYDVYAFRVGRPEQGQVAVLFNNITERKRVEKERRFLDEVSVALSASIEYEQTLANLAQLVVQNFADWSAVDVVDEEGQISRLKVASADPAQSELCAVLEQMPLDQDLPHIMRSVIESKRPIVVERVTLPYIDSVAQEPGHLQALLATGVTSFVAVPLLMRGQPLGALFLGSSTLSRVFGQDDLRLAEELAERAAMAIENARLYRSAVYAAQLRDQVLSVVAHDLRNPLSTILLHTSALTLQSPEPERRTQKPMEVIHNAATHMNRMIQDLLDVALMEAGQLSIERGRLSAGKLVNDAAEMQRPLASSSSIELRVEVASDVPDIWGDRDRLLQVFENLIGNGIKFTHAGGRITAGAKLRDKEVVFWVADTGSGIRSEDLPRVFDRFWQANRTGRHSAGLGLPITRGIVEAHGGRIWVESSAGSGSTFFFTIPRAVAAQENRPDRAA